MVGVQSNNKYLELDSYPEDKHQARLYAYQALNIYKASIYDFIGFVNKEIFLKVYVSLIFFDLIWEIIIQKIGK